MENNLNEPSKMPEEIINNIIKKWQANDSVPVLPDEAVEKIKKIITSEKVAPKTRAALQKVLNESEKAKEKAETKSKLEGNQTSSQENQGPDLG